ncbi:MAG: S9 family peptidase [Phycisphaerales bacterium]|nr:S9 family peptidase [Phycisphaerales bacterium]
MLFKRWLGVLGCTMILMAGCKSAEPAKKSSAEAGKPKADASVLIPRETLFGNPDRASPQISPDGKRLAFLAPVNGVLNVWVGPADRPDQAKAVTNDTSRGIRRYFWAFTNQHIIYLQDKGGDENWRVYSVDLARNDVKDLTPFEKVAAQIQEVSPRFPDEILVALNNRNPQYHDIHRVNIRTGDLKLVTENNEFAGFVSDDDYNVRFAMQMTPDGGSDLRKSDGKGGWQPFAKIGMEDSLTTAPEGLDKEGKVLFMLDSRGRNTAALTAVTLDTGAVTVLGEDPRADVVGVMTHPTEKNVQAYSVNRERTKWTVIDKSIRGDFDELRKVAEGDFSITSRSLDDKTWTVAYVMDNGPVRYYRYERPQKKAEFLFTNNERLAGVTLARMTPVVIKSRDGLELISYLTLPATEKASGGTPRPGKPLPMVLFVHGGPWARDQWGLNPNHQWLANRGYAVLSVNYRGSTGFGKSFINASNMEWAGKMHDDLIDAVNWAVKEKIADPKRVAVMGGSYGGYATLVGLTFTPDTFACGVDIVGPSNLVTLLNTIPPYWAPMIETFTKRVGDHRTEEGRSLLNQRSPLTFADRIKKPLLIGQGANDPRVKQAEADQIVKAMQDKKIPVTYVLYPDEGHGFARPENRMSFNAVAEAFLSQHIGGRFQPIGGDFKGSSIGVPTGSDQVPGLSAAIPKGN